MDFIIFPTTRYGKKTPRQTQETVCRGTVIASGTALMFYSLLPPALLKALCEPRRAARESERFFSAALII